MSQYTNMGTYLTVLDNSEYFPVEPPLSEFGIISSIGKFTKGEVGVPITFTKNDLTEIKSKLGLPVVGATEALSNNKEWWAFYRAFSYSKPNTVFRVINSTFKNPAVKMTLDPSGVEQIPYSTVDGQIVYFTTTGKITETEDTSTIIENSEIADIRKENITLGANDVGEIVYRYPGVNSDSIVYIVVNKKALEETLIIPHLSYTAIATARISTLDTALGVETIEITNAGSGYTAGTLAYTFYKADGVTLSDGIGATLSLTYDVDGSISAISVTNPGSGYSPTDIIKFTVNVGDVVSFKYPQYTFIKDLYDFELEDSDNVLLVYENGSLVEKFLFNGNSSSDYYWANIDSDYVYAKFNDTVLNSTAYQTIAYASSDTFASKGVGIFSDITYADYLATLDYVVDNTLENNIITDGAIPVLFSSNETKVFQQKIISTVVPAIYGFAVLSYPKSVEDTFVGKFNVTDSDLESYVTYKNSLGYNSSDLGWNGILVAPSLQRVFDVFNNVWIWIPVSTDIAGGFTRLGNNYQYSPVEAKRGTFGFDSLNWKIKKTENESYLYKNGVNPIVYRNGTYILKGHKTLTTKNTAFNRANVSRTVSIFKVEARDLGNQFVGELGLPQTLVTATDVYNRFIQNYINEGKLVDAKVVIPNDPADIDNNLMRVNIFIKPVKIFDFVQVTITVLPQGAVIN